MGELMKKAISLSVLLTLFCAGAYAATTCIHSRTVVFTIKKSENAVSSSYNNAEKTFSLRFGYDLVPNNSSQRTLTGMSTCNEITTNTADSAAKSGDANVYLRASSADVGTQCWCSLTSPVTSWWVYYGAFDDEDACDAGCTSACAAAIKDNTSNFRTNGVYLAIW